MLTQAFATAAAPPEGSKPKDLLAAIYAERPDLIGETAYFPGCGLDDVDDGAGAFVDGHRQGGCSYTVIIGDEVFKAPRREWGINSLSKEAATLQRLEDAGLPIPRVTCVGKDAAFYGMTRLPGIQLTRDFLAEWTQEETQRLATDIAAFIAGMAETLPGFDGEKCVHGDLQAKNILIDPETRTLSGIVDFGIFKYSDTPPTLIISDEFREIVCHDERLRKVFDLDSVDGGEGGPLKKLRGLLGLRQPGVS